MVVVAAGPDPAMRIYVPYTEVRDCTMVALLWYLPHVTFVDCSKDDSDYVTYLQRRWRERQTFINVEHDVVPAPGVLDEMWRCREPWCVEPYVGPPETHEAPPFGVVKFSSILIDMIPDVWVRRQLLADRVEGAAWRGLDIFLWDYMRDRDIRPHLHFPLAVHAKHDPRYAPIRRVTADGKPVAAAKHLDLHLDTI